MTTTENIQATEFNQEANIISLDYIPSVKEQGQLFADDSIVLEF